MIKARFSINILENRQQQLLLLKRSASAELGPYLWGFPAGHIYENETPEHCARRELIEEIGPDHNMDLLQQLGPIRDTFYDGVYQIYLFHFRWSGGNIILNHEHTDYAWVSAVDYKDFDVMDGLDEDIVYLDIWPKKYLNEIKLPHLLRHSLPKGEVLNPNTLHSGNVQNENPLPSGEGKGEGKF